MISEAGRRTRKREREGRMRDGKRQRQRGRGLAGGRKAVCVLCLYVCTYDIYVRESKRERQREAERGGGDRCRRENIGKCHF